MKTLRLLLFSDCDRDCDQCCNKTRDLAICGDYPDHFDRDRTVQYLRRLGDTEC
jgi:hypothetical protein